MDETLTQETDTPRPLKRVRPNGYTNSPVLTKPFKTPFRVDSSRDVPSVKPFSNRANTSSFPNSGPISHRQPIKTISEVGKVGPGQHERADSSHQPHRTTETSVPDVETLSAIREAQRHQSRLSTELHTLRQDIDTLEQAIKLATSPRDAELAELIDKWRAAARQAAEEVFSSCKDRVNKMGGVGAWREMELQNQQRQKEWEEDAKVYEEKKRKEKQSREDAESLASESGDDEETVQRKRAKRDGQWQSRDSVDVDVDTDVCTREIDDLQEEEEEGKRKAHLFGDNDDSFTMGMMLKQLGIDLDVIGYSNSRQMWSG